MNRPTCNTCVHIFNNKCWLEPNHVPVDEPTAHGCSHHPEFSNFLRNRDRATYDPTRHINFYNEVQKYNCQCVTVGVPPLPESVILESLTPSGPHVCALKACKDCVGTGIQTVEL